MDCPRIQLDAQSYCHLPEHTLLHVTDWQTLRSTQQVAHVTDTQFLTLSPSRMLVCTLCPW